MIAFRLLCSRWSRFLRTASAWTVHPCPCFHRLLCWTESCEYVLHFDPRLCSPHITSTSSFLTRTLLLESSACIRHAASYCAQRLLGRSGALARSVPSNWAPTFSSSPLRHDVIVCFLHVCCRLGCRGVRLRTVASMWRVFGASRWVNHLLGPHDGAWVSRLGPETSDCLFGSDLQRHVHTPNQCQSQRTLMMTQMNCWWLASSLPCCRLHS